LDLATLVLNKVWVPIHVTTVRRAIVLVYQDAARVVASDSLQTHDFDGWLDLDEPPTTRWIRGARQPIPAPEIVQLTRYDRVPNHDAPFTRRNLFQRDDFTCQYCGRRGNEDTLSIDHVVPRCRGGRTSWENCVLACVRCNARKGDRTPNEAALHLRRHPRRPRWSPYLNLGLDDWLVSWTRFASPTDLARLAELERAREVRERA